MSSFASESLSPRVICRMSLRLSRMPDPGFGRFKRGSPCLICGEPDALVGYFWVAGRVAYLHAACDAVVDAGA